jgi:dUTP pyrophosphatase
MVVKGKEIKTTTMVEKALSKDRVRGFEPVKDAPEGTVLPLQATRTSAGLDFVATETFGIHPQEVVSFLTNVKAYMQEDEVLMIYIRSGMGIKNNLMIANTQSVIDSDFHNNPDNDGNIRIAIRNIAPTFELIKVVQVVDIKGELWDVPVIKDLSQSNLVIIQKGDRVAQGVFNKFLQSDTGRSDTVRVGGVGSTDK